LKKNILAIFVIIGIIAIAFLGYSLFLSGPDNSASGPVGGAAFSKESFPQSLAGNQLAGPVVTGPDALQMINKLHGTNISIVEGYIAQYQGKNQITIWVSQSASTADAQALFEIMDKKMPASQMFTNREELQVEGKKVVKVLGMGQEHYYWVRDTQVYWIAIGGSDTLPVLQEALKAL